MILLNIDNKLDKPIFQQVFQQLKHHIEVGDLAIGENLPSTRKLSELLGVHRTTICRAYDELWALGYIESKVGGYSRVRYRNYAPEDRVNHQHGLINWSDRFSEASKLVSENPLFVKKNQSDVIDFRTLSPDSNLLPFSDFRKCVNHVLKTDSASILDYGHASGYLPLRELLAKNMRQHKIAVCSDEIIITNGMQNGIEMILRLLSNPGDCIVTETPSYAKALSLMKFIGLKVIGIPMTKGGMNLDMLEEYIKKDKPRLIYTIPTFHNPTGLSSSQDHRERLLALCENYQVPLIEDGFEEDMKYFGKAVLPIKSMDRNGVVIYMGTFSKVLFPGIRTGWIVASKELIDKLAKIKSINELSGVTLTQAAIHQFCEQGFFELHKKRLHKAYRKRMHLALQACREFLSDDLIQYTKPDGGYLIWVTLKNKNVSEDELINGLLNNKVAVSPGSTFFTDIDQQLHFRLSIASRNENEIYEGIKRIGDFVIKLNSSK